MGTGGREIIPGVVHLVLEAEDSPSRSVGYRVHRTHAIYGASLDPTIGGEQEYTNRGKLTPDCGPIDFVALHVFASPEVESRVRPKRQRDVYSKYSRPAVSGA